MSDIFCPVTGEVIRRSVKVYGEESKFLTEFEEIRLLGEGGFGLVVQCRNKLDEKIYAVKKILLQQTEMPFDKILREVLALSSMHHPHIVRYFQAWLEPHLVGILEEPGETPSEDDIDENSDSPCLYIQMEYCTGSLGKVLWSLACDDSFNEEWAWIIFRQIVDAVAHIHKKGYIHRDLSRNNIFLDGDDKIKVGDFGLAKLLDGAESSLGFVSGSGAIGTEFYRAPEVDVSGAMVDSKADIYSLGVLLGEIVIPFKTESHRHDELKELRNNGEFPQHWMRHRELIEKLLSRNASERPSAAQILGDPAYQYQKLDSCTR